MNAAKQRTHAHRYTIKRCETVEKGHVVEHDCKSEIPEYKFTVIIYECVCMFYRRIQYAHPLRDCVSNSRNSCLAKNTCRLIRVKVSKRLKRSDDVIAYLYSIILLIKFHRHAYDRNIGGGLNECGCVRERERKRESLKERKREKESMKANAILSMIQRKSINYER